MPRRFNVGDQLVTHGREKLIIREIVTVRDTGYTWKYVGPEYPADSSNLFESENGLDPFFEDPCWSIHKLSENTPDVVVNHFRYMRRHPARYSVWDERTGLFIGYADEPGVLAYDREGKPIPEHSENWSHEAIEAARKDLKQKAIRIDKY